MELYGTDWEMFDAVHEEPYGVHVQKIERHHLVERFT